ncbi:radical SAM protein [Desulfovibrio sulfodismutans]|uniref:Radical SAM protein n=1 Tax=Desulfolutivibrio sulfodismutans TaxID=63561 RepID=A0A7K3NR24_9BACT|nr:radical SAM protein [Desulfolutivibrio sulfodismutans]NDY58660.1 radical SAM protein [Desulfolutivibrio sulfodismutans]QLA12835.1 radical SAM protein [Desulfolutivibrio sulfodismutans DSM 3696]
MIVYEHGRWRSRLGRWRKRLFSILLPHLTPRRAVNLAACEMARMLRLSHVPARPCQLYVEVSSSCQLRCPGCLAYAPGWERRLMDMETFQAALDAFAPWLVNVELYGWGEPFLNRDIFRMIKVCKTKKLFTRTSTNGNAMQRGDAKRLVDSGLDQLNVSLDGATQETYARYRRGGSLATALAALADIVEAKHRAGAKHPFIEWQFIVSRHNYGEIDAVRRLAREIGVDILRLDLPFSLTHIDEADDPQAVERWLAEDPRYRLWAGAGSPGGHAFPGACGYLWTALQVNVHGRVNLCPNRLGSMHVLSDPVTPDGPSVNALWNMPFFLQARRHFERHPRLAPEGTHPCAACREFRQPWKETASGTRQRGTGVRSDG